MKKILSFITVLALIVTAFFGTFTANGVSTANAGSEIDVYFIAGQSNASGQAYYKNTGSYVSTKNIKSTVTYPSEFTTGFSNVLYYGKASDPNGNFNSSLSMSGVKEGLGHLTSTVGTELGIAWYLSDYYNQTTGRTALIVKYSVGASSLNGSVGAPYGNWASPSSAGYYTIAGLRLYDEMQNFIGSMETAVAGKGYSKINYKALLWLQGEADSWNTTYANLYGVNLKTFINDFRNDLFNRTQNAKDKNLPFIISKNCPTYTGSFNSVVRAQQDSVKGTLYKVDTIETDMYETIQGKYGCTDNAHYCYDDIVDLGKRAGAVMYSLSHPGIKGVFSVEGDTVGSITKTTEGENTKLSYNITDGTYTLSKVVKKVDDGEKINEYDITSSLIDNYVLIPSSEGANDVTVTFYLVKNNSGMS
ncbi:MAG: sialate O-acetylesterase [Clostridia bacterium]|nr:sialate O-acetylesterase [Clostridia bacterium]